MAQRLARKACQSCCTPLANSQELITKYKLDELANSFGVESINLIQAQGCEECGHSGYKGRLALLEYLPCDEGIQDIPKNEKFIPLARKYNREKGFRTLMEDGFLKAIKGETTLDEVLRVAG